MLGAGLEDRSRFMCHISLWICHSNSREAGYKTKWRKDL